MISGKSKIADVIYDLEEVLKDTKEKEQSRRLQKAINTLKEHSVTVRLRGTTITFITENVDDIEVDIKNVYNPMTVHEVQPDVVGLSEETMDENSVRYIDTKTVADYYGSKSIVGVSVLLTPLLLGKP